MKERKIKFRAYVNDGGYKRVSEVGEIKFTELTSEPYMVFDECGQRIEAERIVEFTGLKDSNGKEIYEGDIVKYRTPDRELHSREAQGYVFFNERSAGFDIKGERFLGFPKYEGLGDKVGNILAGAITVIGNIYENPELLK